MKRAIIALTIAGSVATSAGVALADSPGNNGNGNNNHNVCVVFADNQKYTNASYLCVSTPNVPPV